MLVNQLTSLVLETTNPNVDDGLSRKERIFGYSSLRLPKGGKTQYQRPVAEDPNIFHTVTEEKVLIPFAILEEVEGSFNFGKKVEYPEFNCMQEFAQYTEGSELDLSAYENQFPGDNSFADSLILGVYFHSLIRKNHLEVPCEVVRLTEKKFNLKLKFIVRNIYVTVVKVSGCVKDEYFFKLNEDDFDYFEFKVAIKQSHSRSGEKAQTRKPNKGNTSDGEVSEQELVNVGIEETER